MRILNIISDDKDRTLGALIETPKGIVIRKTAELRTMYSQGYKFENAILDARGFVRAKNGVIPRKKLTDIGLKRDKFEKQQQYEKEQNIEYNTKIRAELLKYSKTHKLLYHGAANGLQGNIRCDYSNALCDFGTGFYTGTCLIQAENRVNNKPNAIIYAYTLNLDGEKIYIFEDYTLWALFIGYNRKKITLDSILDKNLISLFTDILNNYDIIIGLIADDKIAKAYDEFIQGNITDRCLYECLKLVKYGKQFVFKNNETVNNMLTQKFNYRLTPEMHKDSISWGQEIKKFMDERIDEFKKQYRNVGNYIDQCLEAYRE